MKKALLILFAAIILGGTQIASAQVDGPYDKDPTTNEQSVTLGVNQSKKIFDGKLMVKVVAVVEDSRCPKDVDCIQAGNAKVRVSFRKGNDPLKVVDLDLNAGQTSAMYGNYKITLTALTPYPATAAPIKRNRYMATLTVAPAAG
jgi:hypothetical protein